MEVLRGVVNTWECDEMGHMNVRFYVSRAWDGLCALAGALGMGARVLRARGETWVPREHHIRFHREVHPGHSLSMRGGIVALHEDDTLETYQELWREDDGVLSATVRTRVSLCSAEELTPRALPDELRERARSFNVLIPAHGLPRGIALSEPAAPITRAQTEAWQLFPVYRGRVGPMDVDSLGRLNVESFMGRISDGVPHFFRALGDLSRDTEHGIGGAALEYRLLYRAIPQLGDLLETRAGLKGQNGKVTQFCHYMFDAESGELVVSAEAVAVLFDLKTRKAVAPAAEAIERLNRKAVPQMMI